MLAELVTKLVSLGKDTVAVSFHTRPECPRKIWVQHGQNLTPEDVQPPLRLHHLAGLEDLVNALNDKAMAPDPEVYVADSVVQAYLDRKHRREVVKVSLKETTRFGLVRQLQEARSMTPKQAVKLLKIDLHGGNVSHLTNALSRIEFTRTGTGRTDVEHGRESLGKSVEAQVQNAKDVPEQVDLAVQVWSTAGFDRFGVNVRLSCYLDLDAQCVELRVLPDEIGRVMNLAMGSAVGELGARLQGVPIFLGTP